MPVPCDCNRLPLGLSDFTDIRENDMIYIDKTEFLAKIATRRTPIFLSRPRRFGKSLLVNTLHSLFSRGLKDFHGLYIEKIWKDTTYHVVHLDFSDIAGFNAEDFSNALSTILIQEFKGYDAISPLDSPKIYQAPNLILRDILSALKNKSIVLLIDEYDAPLTRHIDRPDELNKLISILDNFYSVIKHYTNKFRFIFITGVTRTSHVSIFSAFNNLIDLSFDENYNALLGFTQQDLQNYFDPYIENAADVLQMSKEDMYKRLEQYYDGFQFSTNTEVTLYNPWSILNFLTFPDKGFKNYWFHSGGSSSLIMHYLKITDSFDFMSYKDREIYISNNNLSCHYEISNIPRNILLYQAGYFTIRRETALISKLVLPNREVEDSMLQLYLTANNLDPHITLSRKIDNLPVHIDDKDIAYILDTFNEILNDCVSILSTIFEDERSIRDIIYAAIPHENYVLKIKEHETAAGRSDLELVTNKTHMVIEFKRTYAERDPEASLQEAVSQLQSKRYGVGYFPSHTLYRVAMVVSTEKRAILSDFCKEV